MSDQSDTDRYTKIRTWVAVAGLLVAIVAIVFGGNFFYNEVWRGKRLVYTILPAYDLGDQVFSGVVVENQGNVGLTEIELIISGLEFSITTLNMPGPHETIVIAEGGEGEKNLVVKMPRLSKGTSLAIYMLTEGHVTLEQGKTMQITSKEVTGKLSSESGGIDTDRFWIVALAGVVGVVVIYIVEVVFARYIQDKKAPRTMR